jgi:BlaI family transcriptional regulator, penicillinase repressor
MATQKPTESELEILHLLWKNGSSSVREIHEELSTRRELGYTTTLKIMQIMNEKGLLKRDTAAKSHIYSANVKEGETKNTLLTDFVNSAFQGSSMHLVMQVLGNGKSTQSELDELKSLISQIENQEP